MPKTPKGRLSPEKAAEKAKPGWRAVTPAPSDAPRLAGAEENAPELEALRRKYLGNAIASTQKATRPRKGKVDDLTMVVMEPVSASDTRVGRKVVVVNRSGKKVGDQG
jgi:hypothetical protein